MTRRREPASLTPPTQPVPPASSNELPEGFKMTELGPLPEEWDVARLHSLGRISAGGSAPQGSQYFRGTNPFVRVQHLDEDGYQVRRWDLITEDAVRKYRLSLFPSGTIVFPKSGASIRLEKRAVLARPSYLVSHLCAIVPNKDVVDRDFLFFALRSIPLGAEKAEGYPTLSLREIRQRCVPLPPLPEQRAIARVLRTVQRAKEATERVIGALKELKKSLMQHLFTYGPVPVDQADQVRLKETEIGPVPEEREVVRLGHIARVRYGRAKPKGVGTVPVIGSGGRYASTSKPLVLHPTLVVGRKGTAGQVSLVDEPSWPSDTTFYLEWLSNDVNQRFVYHYLQVKPLSGEHARTTLPSLQKPDLENYLLPLPTLPEQQAIAENLRSVDRKIEAEESRKQALEALFESLLHHLMTGKIRVKDLTVPGPEESL
jgi:type I restriction enzyme S subunit